MRLVSLRFRLIAAAAVWVTAGFVAAFFALSAIFREHVTEQFFEELFVHVDELRRLSTETPQGQVVLRSVFSDPRYDVVGSGFYWEVRDDDIVRLKSPSLGDGRIGELAQSLEGDDERPRLESRGPTGELLLTEVTQPAEGGAVRRFIIGTDERHLDSLVSRFNGTLIVALLTLGGAMILAAGAIAAFGLAPFNSLARALRDVRSGKTGRLEGVHPSEVQPLVSELNALIEAGRQSVDKARAQAGSLAHSLKTPLAVVVSEAYELEGRGESGSSNLIIDQCRTMQRHIDHHIARARASALSRLPGVTANVSEAARDVAAALSRLHAGSGKSVEIDVAETLQVPMDSQDLREVLGNLVDNAFKHATRRIRLTASSGEDSIRLCVEDDGPGIRPEDRDLVLQAGARLVSGAPGSGLGLAIVADLMHHYRGRLELSGSPLGGLSTTISFGPR